MTSDGAATPTRQVARIGIGEVLRRLRGDFPDVSISKIRFLESEGLVQPTRTPSGYRKFSADDIEQLRYVLAAQRDRYLPLRVIREHLDLMARGLQPAATAGGTAHVAEAEGGESGVARRTSGPRLTADELLSISGLARAQLDELREYGVLAPVPGTGYYDARSLEIAKAAAGLVAHGLEPRHLRAFKTAADREAGLVDQVVEPLARQRGEQATARAATLRGELLEHAGRLHAALLVGDAGSPGGRSAAE